MGSPGLAPSATSYPSTATSRIRREDFHRTKHDSVFSKWKVLIGPWDWENHKAGKEGAERYRVGNLPSLPGPGLYEIGVAVWRTDSGRDVAKLELDRIVVVYLGQAENVRSRLQHYGRSGSHLFHQYDHRTALFNDIFSKGIVYRWAFMENKSEAERTEARLLQKFDYAWNKVGNGARRPNDVLTEIKKIDLRSNSMPKIAKMLKSLGDKKVGIPIKAKLPNHDEEFGRIIKFGRSQLRIVSSSIPDKIIHAINIDNQFSHICVCGVTLSDGSTCSKPPVEGRKRCAEHKGKRLNSRPKNLIVMHNQTDLQAKFPSKSAQNVEDDHFSPIRGVLVPQLDGSVTPCEKARYPGRKQCLEHQGMRVNQISSSSPISISKLEPSGYCGVDIGDGRCCMVQPVKGRKRCEMHKGMRIGGMRVNQISSSSPISISKLEPSGYCGVDIGYGRCCMVQPVTGRMRCEMHKGMRIGGMRVNQISSSFPISISKLEPSGYCGVDIGYGRCCMVQPVKGRKRCEMHKGMRIGG